MGYYNYFIYPKYKNVSLDKLAIVLSKYRDVIDLFCETETKEPIKYFPNVQFDRDSIRKVDIPTGTKGLIIGTDIHNVQYHLCDLDRLIFKPEVICLDQIFLSYSSMNQPKCYKDLFEDKQLSINVVEHYANLSEKHKRIGDKTKWKRKQKRTR